MEWMNYHHLHYFWRIAREGGLSRAAERLRISHSTLSAQLRAFEKFLGGELFERRGRNLVLTPLGEEVAGYADDIFRLGGELVEAARGLPHQRKLALRVGVVGDLPKTVAYRLLRPAIEAAGFGPISLRLNTLERLLEDLAGGRLHCVLSDAPPPEASTHRLFAHLLGASDVVLYGVPDLARAHRRGFPGSLHGAPFLLPTPSSSLRRQIDRWLVERGVTVRLVGEFEDAGLMRVVGVHGHGIFPVRGALRAEVEESHSVTPIGRLEGIVERYYIVSTERRVRHPAVSAVIEQARIELGTEVTSPPRRSGRTSTKPRRRGPRPSDRG